MAYRSFMPEPETSGYPFQLPIAYSLARDDLGNLSKTFTPGPNILQFLEQKKHERGTKDDATLNVEGGTTTTPPPQKENEVTELMGPREIMCQQLLFEPSLNDNVDKNARSSPPLKRKFPEPKGMSPPSKKPSLQRGTVTSSFTPRKPPGDPKDYRIITLSNGIRAVLISSEDDCHCPPKKAGKVGINLLEESSREEQEAMERQSYLPLKFPLLPVGVTDSVKYLELLALKDDQDSEAKNDIMGKQTTKDETVNGGGTSESQSQGGAGDCPRKSKICPPAMVAVVVNVGVCDDPDDCLGLAHFTEHMVHYGSAKFPQEDAYINLALNHGHGFNAFTENSTTTYYTVMPDDLLGQGMEMISSMLHEPSFAKDMTTREINSVDAEFHLKRHHDVLRRFFLFQTALKPDHPLKKFGFGNEESLLKSKSSIHKNLRELHQKYYKPGAMTVGVESSVLPLDEQEELVIQTFGNIPKGGNRKTVKDTPIPAAERSVEGPLFNRYYVIQGLSHFSDLWVTWPVPLALFNEKEHKTLTMVCALLEDVSEGGLSHSLAKQGLIWLMVVPSPIDHSLMENKFTGFIAMEILLTQKGVTQPRRILEAIYSYIEFLRGVPESTLRRLFNELKLDALRRLKYGGTQDSGPLPFKRRTDAAMELAKNLQYGAPDEIFNTPLREWQKATYSHAENMKVLSLLTQSNMNVVQTIPKNVNLREFTNNGVIHRAPYTNAEYCVGKRAGDYLDNKKNFTFSLKPNQFMDGVNDQLNCCGVITQHPIQMRHCNPSKVVKALHLGNTNGNYRAACLFTFFSPAATANPRNFALSLLWASSTMLTLTSTYGKAAHAGLQFHAAPHPLGMEIKATGFPEKLLDVLEAVTDQLFSPAITETEFLRAQSALISLFEILYANNNEYITQDLLLNMTCNPFSEVVLDAITYVKKVNFIDVNNFAAWFKQQATALVLVEGNLEPGVTAAKIDAILNRQKYYPHQTNLTWLNSISNAAIPSISPLPLGQKRIRIMSDVSTSYTTTVNNFYCVGKFNEDEFMLWHSALYFFRAKSFYELRTKKQLGYDVHPYFPKPEIGKPIMLGVGITATATKFTACELDKEIDEFMFKYGKYLERISESEFTAVKTFRGQINQLTVSDVAAWYQAHFGDMFASKEKNRYHYLGMSKISIQLIGNESKGCKNCPTCNSIGGWKKGDNWHNFKFAEGTGPDNCFVTNPKSIGGS